MSGKEIKYCSFEPTALLIETLDLNNGQNM